MKVLILAAGEGKRLSPLTLSTPKPLLPITPEHTVLSRLVSQLKAHGLTDITVSVDYLKEQFEEPAEKMNLKLLHERYTAHAVRKMLCDKLLVVSGDLYLNLDFTQLVNRPGSSTMVVRYDPQTVGYVSRYGQFMEKPEYVNAGVYVVSRNSVGYDDSLDITEALGHTVSPYVINPDIGEFVIDIGESMEVYNEIRERNNHDGDSD